MDLKRWKNRETITLVYNGVKYVGRVIYDFQRPECYYNNNFKGRKEYYFEIKENGKRIKLTRKSVSLKEGGLVFKLK
ncbi:MAG: hypothetical protein QXX55_02085 [Candidatus Pacearchaeota archaeon]